MPGLKFTPFVFGLLVILWAAIRERCKVALKCPAVKIFNSKLCAFTNIQYSSGPSKKDIQCSFCWSSYQTHTPDQKLNMSITTTSLPGLQHKLSFNFILVYRRLLTQICVKKKPPLNNPHLPKDCVQMPSQLKQHPYDSTLTIESTL